MKNSTYFVIFFCLYCFCSMTMAITAHTLTSPNKAIALSIDVANQISITQPVNYSVSINDKKLLTQAKAFMRFQQGSQEIDTFTLVNTSISGKKQVVTPIIKQKSATILDHYNSITFTFSNKLTLEFRAYNNGVAYQFRRKSIPKYQVLSETVDLSFAHEADSLFPQEESFVSHNERLYLAKKLSKITQQQFASLPLLVNVNDTKLVLTETALNNYPGLWLKGTKQNSLSATFPRYVEHAELKKGSDRNENIIKRANYLANYSDNKAINFPWRVIAIAENDKDLLTNQLSFLLAQENKIKNTDWIKPGKVAWDWWNANNVYGVDFPSGINTKTYKYYVDFAAKYGLEYIILDEGWYQLGDVLDINPAIDVQEVIQYAKSKNVNVILWVIWETLEQKLLTALDTFQQWGAAGIKIDFMQRDDQYMVNYYWRVAKEAAKRELLVNFHGSYKPAGLRRTFPNVITREGVRGLEHNKWADYITSSHNLTLPFIRMLAGPMDYTPGAMINAQPENFNVVFERPMSKTTRAHQVAMYVIYESPLQMLADSPSNYLKENETTQFISAIPTVWDDTLVISAKISDHIVMARRNGSSWYVGVMNNEQAKTFDISLDFLSDQQYQMHTFADGINAEKYASDFKLTHQIIQNKEALTVNVKPNGGWVAIFTPLNN